jgi:hypothetical protein
MKAWPHLAQSESHLGESAHQWRRLNVAAYRNIINIGWLIWRPAGVVWRLYRKAAW